MGDLTLDLKPSTSTPYTSRSISVLLREISMIGNVSEKLSKVDGYVKSLEEEMKKIDAFKRELPLCMLLLNDAIGALKCEIMQWKPSDVGPVMENLLPLKGNEIDLRDKKSWMSSVQLWSSHEKQKPVQEMAREYDRSDNIFPRSGGGAFLPFKGVSGWKEEKEKEKEIQLEPGLSLLTPGIKKARAEPTSCLMNSISNSYGGSRAISSPSSENTHSSLQPLQSQNPRKQRRCWSPDLHRRFLNALQQLGGSQVATPKQIRELMKVDGLTNDEVKSHLQKYRLHTRRYPASTNNASVTENQKLVMFGGLWVPQDQCRTSKATTSESESPQGPLQLMGVTSGGSTTGNDSMEDEEDGKSESYNWKGEFYKPGEDDA